MNDKWRLSDIFCLVLKLTGLQIQIIWNRQMKLQTWVIPFRLIIWWIKVINYAKPGNKQWVVVFGMTQESVGDSSV